MKLDDESKRFIEAIDTLVKARKETSLEMSELQISQERLIDALEKLTSKIDKFIQFEERLARVESLLF